MQKSQERRQWALIRIYHPFRGGGGEKVSAIFANGDAEYGDRGSAQESQSGATDDHEGENQREDLEESGTWETDISNLGGGGDVEIPPCTEMHVSTVTNVHRNRNGEGGWVTSRVSNLEIHCIW